MILWKRLHYLCVQFQQHKTIRIMIRLNVFFEKKEDVKAEEINALCKELV